MGEIIMRSWNWREYCVQVNFRSPVWQVRVLIWGVITMITSLCNQIRQVVPQISHIYSYPPRGSHHHPPSLSSLSPTQPSSQNRKLHYLLLTLHAMICSWHREQQTLSWESTRGCLSSLFFYHYKLTPECRINFWRTSVHDWVSSSFSPLELNSEVTLSHSHGCELTTWWVVAQHPAHHALTVSKYLSKLARSQPPSLSPNLLDYSPHVHRQTHLVAASKFPRLWPPSAHPKTCSVRTCKGISKQAWSQPTSVSPNSVDYSLHILTIMGSQWISQLAR